MNGVIEGIIGNLVSSVLLELSGPLRRKLEGDPQKNALRDALAEALEESLKGCRLSPEDTAHYEGLFQDLFKSDPVLAELGQLLDARNDLYPDLANLARELEEMGLDSSRLPHFDLEEFLRTFLRAFYAAAARQDALQGVLNLKLMGAAVERLGSIAGFAERGALASERLAEGMEDLNRSLQSFMAEGVSESAFLGGIYGFKRRRAPSSL